MLSNWNCGQWLGSWRLVQPWHRLLLQCQMLRSLRFLYDLKICVSSWQYHCCITQHRPPRNVSFVDWRVEGTSFIPYYSKGTDIVYLLCCREWQQDPHASLCCRYEIFDLSTTIKFREGESRYQVKIDLSYRRCIYDVFTIWTWNTSDTYDVSSWLVVEEETKLVELRLKYSKS